MGFFFIFFFSYLCFGRGNLVLSGLDGVVIEIR